MERNETTRTLGLMLGLAAASVGWLAGCGSSSGSKVTPDASADVVDAPAAPDRNVVLSFCTGPAPRALIDDMSGPSISLPPLPCGTEGEWNLVVQNNDPAKPATITVPTGNLATMSNCGSLCQPLYSPLPTGYPGSNPPPVDAGLPQAMCIAGQAGAALYDTAGMILTFGFSGPVPVASKSSMLDGGVPDGWPPVELVDASAYAGIEFWLWVSPETAAVASSNFLVMVADKNQTAGGGVCDRWVAEGPTACAAAAAGVSGGAATSTTGAGPLLDDNGRLLASIAGGWQRVQVPWDNFRPNPGWGGANESALDPTTLAGIAFIVQQQSQRPTMFPFDFCVFQLAFLPKPVP
jgi:hypothetical protein